MISDWDTFTEIAWYYAGMSTYFGIAYASVVALRYGSRRCIEYVYE